MKRILYIILLLATFGSFSLQGQTSKIIETDQKVCWQGDSTILEVLITQVGRNSDNPYKKKYYAPGGIEINPKPLPTEITYKPCGGANIDFEPLENLLDSLIQQLNENNSDTIQNFEELISQFDSILMVRNQDTLIVRFDYDSLASQIVRGFDSLKVDINMDSLGSIIAGQLHDIEINSTIDYDSLSIAIKEQFDSLKIETTIDYDSLSLAIAENFDSLQIDVNIDYDSLKIALTESLEEATINIDYDSLAIAINEQYENNLNQDSLKLVLEEIRDLLSAPCDTVNIRFDYDSLASQIIKGFDSLKVDINMDSLGSIIAEQLQDIEITSTIDYDSLSIAIKEQFDSLQIDVVIDYDSLSLAISENFDSLQIDVRIDYDSLKIALTESLEEATINIDYDSLAIAINEQYENNLNKDSLKLVLEEIRDLLSAPCDTVNVRFDYDSLASQIVKGFDSLNLEINLDSLGSIIAEQLQDIEITTTIDYDSLSIAIKEQFDNLKIETTIDYDSLSLAIAENFDSLQLEVNINYDSIGKAVAENLDDIEVVFNYDSLATLIGEQFNNVSQDSLKYCLEEIRDLLASPCDTVDVKFNIDELVQAIAEAINLDSISIKMNEQHAVFSYELIDFDSNKCQPFFRTMTFPLSETGSIPDTAKIKDFDYFGKKYTPSGQIGKGSCPSLGATGAGCDISKLDSISLQILAELQEGLEVQINYDSLSAALAEAFDFDLDIEGLKFMFDSMGTIIHLPMCELRNDSLFPYIRLISVSKVDTTFRDINYKAKNIKVTGQEGIGCCSTQSTSDNRFGSEKVDSLLEEMLLVLQSPCDTVPVTFDYEELATQIAAKITAEEVANCQVQNITGIDGLGSNGQREFTTNTFNRIEIRVTSGPVSISMDESVFVLIEPDDPPLIIEAETCKYIQTPITVFSASGGNVVFFTRQ